MWVFAYEEDKSSSMWILYGEVIRVWKFPDQNRCEVFMQNELFYGEGNQITDGRIEGWQPPDPRIGYTIVTDYLFDTQQEAQRSGIRALLSGRVF